MGGTVSDTLKDKRGWNRKEERGNKDFKKRGGETKILKRGGKLCQGVGGLKRREGGCWNPLTNYAL